MATCFVSSSLPAAGKPLTGDVVVVVGSRPGHLLVVPASALRWGVFAETPTSALRLAPASAVGWGASQHATPACFTDSGAAPALSSVTMRGMGVVVPGAGSTGLGSSRINSTSGRDGFCDEAEAFRLEVEEARRKYEPSLKDSMTGDIACDQIARTAGHSIDLLVTTMNNLLPSSRANPEDARRIATKFLHLEEACITGKEGFLLADSVDGAMEGLREMWALYVPSTEPLAPAANADAALPSLPGWENEVFFRKLARDFEELYFQVEKAISCESGSIDSAVSEAEAFRLAIQEARGRFKPALHGSMMDHDVYEQILRTAGDSLDLLLATMDKLPPSSRANRGDALRIATVFMKLEQDCSTAEAYLLLDSIDGAMDGLSEMRKLYVRSTEPLPGSNAHTVLPSMPGLETEFFFRNLANNFQQLYCIVRDEIVGEYGPI